MTDSLLCSVAEARGLRTADFLSSAPDPYAVLQLREVRYQTRKERSTKNPSWHQEFELYVALSSHISPIFSSTE